MLCVVIVPLMVRVARRSEMGWKARTLVEAVACLTLFYPRIIECHGFIGGRGLDAGST